MIEANHKYVAAPTELVPYRPVSEEFVIYGDSEKEVLEKLVTKIEGLRKEDLFSKKNLNA